MTQAVILSGYTAISFKITLKRFVFFPEHRAIWNRLRDVWCCTGGAIWSSGPGNWVPSDSRYYGNCTVHDKSLGLIRIIWQRHLHNNGSVYWKSNGNMRNAWHDLANMWLYRGEQSVHLFKKKACLTPVQFDMRQESQTFLLKTFPWNLHKSHQN